MVRDVTRAEIAVFDDISALGASLWEVTRDMEGLSTDPKVFSALLFQRLWSNHRAFALLWTKRLHLEADIILRSGVEAAICIAANLAMGDEFLVLLRRDAAFTLQGQIKLNRDTGDVDMVKHQETVLRDLQSQPPRLKAAKLDWKDLATKGGLPLLYTWHRMLSGLSSHVTGASVLNQASLSGEAEQMHRQLARQQRRLQFMMMAGATTFGSMRHATMLENTAVYQTALALVARLDQMSEGWRGIDL